MTAPYTWPNFAAFNGTLSVASLTPNPTLDVTVDSLTQAVEDFRNWLNQIRLNPEAHGFNDEPAGSVSAVVRLLDKFFPSDGSIVHFSTKLPPDGQGGQSVIDPVMVPFGTVPGSMLGIVDGPSALGYLFSVVQPPTGLSPTWENYFLPLTVLYAWSIYLAYIKSDGTSNPASVPKMSCVMYLPRPSGPPFFYLGHTKARNIVPAAAATDTRENVLALSYRSRLIQQAALAAAAPLPDLAGRHRPRMREALFEVFGWPYEPQDDHLPVEDFLQPVFKDMGSGPKTQLILKGAEATLENVQIGLCTAMKLELINEKTPITWPTTNIMSNRRLQLPVTSKDMVTAVDGLVAAYIAGQDTTTFWIKLLVLYISPSILVPRANPSPTNPPQTNPPQANPPQANHPQANPPQANPPQANPPQKSPPQKNPPNKSPPQANPPQANPSTDPSALWPAGSIVPVPAMTAALIQDFVGEFYTLKENDLNTKLAKVVQFCRGRHTSGLVDAGQIALEQKWIEKFRKDVEHDFGRCAETYPAYAISQLFYPNNMVVATDGPNIRGCALNSQYVGKGAAESKLFNGGFNTTQLDAISIVQSGPVYRLPCSTFCKTMLQNVQARDTEAKQEAYNDDVKATPMTVPLTAASSDA